MAGHAEKIQGWIKTSREYFRDVYGELKKVSWPSREETISKTKVTLVVILIFAIIIALFDLPITYLIKFILG